MSINLKAFEMKAIKLPLKERAKLAEYLIRSLDKIDDSENERLWVKEAERRYNDYKKGKMSSRPAEEVLRYAHKILK
ncbi:MAG: addiction module protein [Elusimicrobiota bacterium]